MPPKRKAAAAVAATKYTDPTGSKPNKRSKTSKPQPKAFTNGVKQDSEEPHFDHSRPEERAGIVDRRFYPAEISNERCAMYNADEIPRPMEVLNKTLSETKTARGKAGKSKGDAVVHWFKRDLRVRDNTGLGLASKKAKEKGVGVIGVWILSPQDWEAHLVSPAKCDFELRSLKVLREDLAKLDIPLYVEVVGKRKDIPGRFVELAKEWNVKNVFCNLEYEVDELRREEQLAKLMLESGINFEPVHDDCVVPPGALKSGSGKQYAVYSPWFRAWIAHLHNHPHLLNERPMPEKNSAAFKKKFKKLYDMDIPVAPDSKKLPSKEDEERLERLWPAGENEALDRLSHFLNEKIGIYQATRNFPAKNSTARVSVHHAAGTLAARTSARLARDVNSTKKLDGGIEGIKGWISEVAWRDFYRHVLVNWPYICMNKPFKYEYTSIEWEYNDEHFRAWTQGRTGYPIVDAAMRSLNSTAYMHNRLRMITASFLAKHLLLDWRLGEQYFISHLIDGDFASNNGGWGFSSSTGVDPQPYFRIFNPWTQTERFDEDGEFIRQWVPELKDVKGQAILNPYDSGAEAAGIAEKNGYPKVIVDHKFARDRALARYKAGIGRNTA